MRPSQGKAREDELRRVLRRARVGMLGLCATTTSVSALMVADAGLVGAGAAGAGSVATLCALAAFDDVLLRARVRRALSVPLWRLGLKAHGNWVTREAVAAHEAGHLLVGSLYGCGVYGYELRSDVGFLLTGLGGCVRCANVSTQSTDALTDHELSKTASLLMAGIAAEHLLGAPSTTGGGANDLLDVDARLRTARPSWTHEEREEYMEVALYEAHHRLCECEPVWRALIAAMLRGESFARCCAVVSHSYGAAMQARGDDGLPRALAPVFSSPAVVFREAAPPRPSGSAASGAARRAAVAKPARRSAPVHKRRW
jgi:hypothetical protein